jgi:hypothetical protein
MGLASPRVRGSAARRTRPASLPDGARATESRHHQGRPGGVVPVSEELVKRNCAVVKYPPPEHPVVDLDQDGRPLRRQPTIQATTTPLSTTRVGLASAVRS